MKRVWILLISNYQGLMRRLADNCTGQNCLCFLFTSFCYEVPYDYTLLPVGNPVISQAHVVSLQKCGRGGAVGSELLVFTVGQRHCSLTSFSANALDLFLLFYFFITEQQQQTECSLRIHTFQSKVWEEEELNYSPWNCFHSFHSISFC